MAQCQLILDQHNVAPGHISSICLINLPMDRSSLASQYTLIPRIDASRASQQRPPVIRPYARPLRSRGRHGRFYRYKQAASLDEELLNLVLDGLDLRVELTGLVGGDRGGDDGARDAAGTAEGGLGGNAEVSVIYLESDPRGRASSSGPRGRPQGQTIRLHGVHKGPPIPPICRAHGSRLPPPIRKWRKLTRPANVSKRYHKLQNQLT